MWDQDATLLGWTCGNLAARAAEVAAFFWDLLVARTVVSPRALAMMADVSPLSAGWAKGYLSYGTGLMLQQTSTNGTRPPVATEWGAYLGHGGETCARAEHQRPAPRARAPPRRAHSGLVHVAGTASSQSRV